MTSPTPLFWELSIKLEGEGESLLGEGGRQKLREKLADYTRKFILRRKRINAVGDAAGEMPDAGAELLNIERDADHARMRAGGGEESTAARCHGPP